jgi:hypothetical protein
MKKISLTIIFSIFILSVCFSQDIITLKSGEQIKAKVTEVGITEIKYKRSDNLNGPAYVVAKSDITGIRYENGATDIFTTQTNNDSLNSAPIQLTQTDSIIAAGSSEDEIGSYSNDFIVSNKGDTTDVRIKKVAKGALIYRSLNSNKTHTRKLQNISKAYYADGTLLISDGKLVFVGKHKTKPKPKPKPIQTKKQNVSPPPQPVAVKYNHPDTSITPVNNDMYSRGQADALKYYKGDKNANAITCAVGCMNPIIGLIPAAIASSTPPKDYELNYPDPNLFQNPDYHQGYVQKAKAIKRQKIWTNYGLAALATIAIEVILITALMSNGMY